MERHHKSYLLAYVLWLGLGLFAAHRFYLARGATALLFCVFHIAGWALLIYSKHTQDEDMLWGGLLLLAACGAWLLVDLIFIPAMVDGYNDKLDEAEGPYTRGPISTDPSFQATLKKAGVVTSGSGKKSIPDDYVLPWRQDGDGPKGTDQN